MKGSKKILSVAVKNNIGLVDLKAHPDWQLNIRKIAQRPTENNFSGSHLVKRKPDRGSRTFPKKSYR
jgi:hypothetical protein